MLFAPVLHAQIYNGRGRWCIGHSLRTITSVSGAKRLTSGESQIAVIIAAYNASATIARSVQSALAAAHVAEVVVVDDASSDDTAEAATAASAGDPRFKMLRQEVNQGPSAARNRAIRESHAPLIAILDADDFFLPERFERILAEDDWDLCADNIVFVADPTELDGFSLETNGLTQTQSAVVIDFQHFVRGNIAQPRGFSAQRRVRGELGFLKPVIRRAFLDEHGLSYDEMCRLGEDFLLYTRSLALGARMKVVPSCGYAALVRSNSLSSQHRIEDLAALLNGSRAILAELPLSPDDRHALEQHAASIERKVHHREVLRMRGERGIVAGILEGLGKPTALVDIASERLLKPHERQSTPRFLMTDESLTEHAR